MLLPWEHTHHPAAALQSSLLGNTGIFMDAGPFEHRLPWDRGLKTPHCCCHWNTAFRFPTGFLPVSPHSSPGQRSSFQGFTLNPQVQGRVRKAAGTPRAFPGPAQISGSCPWGSGLCQNPQALLSSCSWHQEKYPLKDDLNTRTTAEKFRASPVSFLQADPLRKDQETERTLLKAKYIAGISKTTGEGIKHI